LNENPSDPGSVRDWSSPKASRRPHELRGLGDEGGDIRARHLTTSSTLYISFSQPAQSSYTASAVSSPRLQKSSKKTFTATPLIIAHKDGETGHCKDTTQRWIAFDWKVLDSPLKIWCGLHDVYDHLSRSLAPVVSSLRKKEGKRDEVPPSMQAACRSFLFSQYTPFALTTA